jgi:hypothetical protein
MNTTDAEIARSCTPPTGRSTRVSRCSPISLKLARQDSDTAANEHFSAAEVSRAYHVLARITRSAPGARVVVGLAPDDEHVRVRVGGDPRSVDASDGSGMLRTRLRERPRTGRRRRRHARPRAAAAVPIAPGSRARAGELPLPTAPPPIRGERCDALALGTPGCRLARRRGVPQPTFRSSHRGVRPSVGVRLVSDA